MWRRKAVLLVILIAEGLPLTFGDTIEVNSDITTNQIWTADNIYRITETISVQALLVIEPGTIIKFAYDKSLIVDNGGALVSCGTPDNPIIYTYDSDPQQGAYCAIYIDETASASTKITYSYIEYAYIGIWIMNNRLDSPIENNYLYNNSTGILEYGIEHTDVYNNLIYVSYYSGIEINMESYEGEASADSHILIQNNTCDYSQYDGIVVFGVEPNEADAGEVELINNIVSGANQYGLVLANGWMIFTVANTGYYDNAANKFWDFEEFNPVYETTLPYVEGTGTLPICYLNPNSAFVNASDEYIEQTRLIGKTTDINGFPDSNLTDLGFHYPNWNFSNAGATTLYADFDGNWRVDFNDLSEFADYWLYDYNYNYQCWWWDWFDDGVIDFYDLAAIMDHWLSPYDFSDFADFAQYWRREVDYRFQDRRFDLVLDNFVDFKDFSKFAEQWRLMAETANPPIAVTILGNPDNLMGKVDIGVSGRIPTTIQGFVFVDGELSGRTSYNEDLGMASEYVNLDTRLLGNGQHSIKAVAIDSNGLITVSNPTSVNLNNELYYLFYARDFNQGEDYHLYAMSDSPDEFKVKLTAWDGNNVWTSSPSTGGLNVSIPSGILSGAIYDLSIEMQEGSLLGTRSESISNMSFEIEEDSPLSWEQVWSDTISRIFPINDSYKVAIFLPNGRLGTGEPTADCRKQAVAELVRWSTLKGMKFIVLYKGQCTWQNFATVLSHANTNYVYMVAHGGNVVPNNPNYPNPVHRLWFEVSGAGNKDINDVEYVFSRRNGLPLGWEVNPRGHSMEGLGLWQWTYIRLVYMTVCFQGESDEMAVKWLNTEMGYLNQVFCGFIECHGNNADWKDWDYQFWCRLGNGQQSVDDVVGGPIPRRGLYSIYPNIWDEFRAIGDKQNVYFNP